MLARPVGHVNSRKVGREVAAADRCRCSTGGSVFAVIGFNCAYGQ